MADGTGVSDALGLENKTRAMTDNLVATAEQFPSMSSEQQGAVVFGIFAMVAETIIEKKIPLSGSKTDFVVTSNGTTIPIPDGASGPKSPQKGTGMTYDGGSGGKGKGMNSRTTGVRIMDANSNQERRVNYMNSSGQTVDPASGRTISNKDPRGHLPIPIDLEF